MARRSTFLPGSVLGKKEPDTRDLTERVVDRALKRSPEPVEPEPERQNEASVLSTIRQDNNTESQQDDNTPIRIADNMPATPADLDSCSLPTTPEAVRRFLAHVGDDDLMGRIAVTFKIPLGLDVLLVRLLSPRSYADKRYKQNIIIRGILLALYEEYTGKKLVDFDAENLPK